MIDHPNFLPVVPAPRIIHPSSQAGIQTWISASAEVREGGGVMATIIQTGPNSFIVGDPIDVLPVDSHWCGYCAGAGLEYDIDDELTVCLSCRGSGAVVCDDPACDEHAR